MKKVCVFLADGFEEIEGLAVVDLLRRAGIETDMISITGQKEVTGSHHITVIADNLFDQIDCETYDMLVLPGGMPGTLNLGAHSGIVESLKQFQSQDKWIAAICAAPTILGQNHILEGKRAVCYPGNEEKLLGATVLKENVVNDGKIITSRGMGTAIDFGLVIIEKLVDQETALKIKTSICYDI
jgi:4-methyl-5(b-hydroxyethyl)-thiazole monophosphate biosynthesis